jgi:NAD(P)-dependent dehydrogenase (short-subunit alcohol dehydrogenase family)
MDLRDKTVLILGGAGLVGLAVARRAMLGRPSRIVIGSLREDEARQGVEVLRGDPAAEGIALEPVWGDLFVPRALKDRPRSEVLVDPEARRLLVEDLYGELDEAVFSRSTYGTLLEEVSPDIIVDCVNTAGALAYQNVFASAARLRSAASAGSVGAEDVDAHLATLYLPQLIRHTQIALEGMKRAGTEVFVKVGTAGTGGMGLNIPFTHSEERPSRVLLAKAGIAGAQTLFLFLMARTPGAPAVKEVKPTAAISWKSIGTGPILRGGRTIPLADATEGLPLGAAFEDGAERGYTTTEEVLEGVYLDAGENGLFSLAEFEALTALGLMEFVTPEEIAENVVREILSHPTGKDVVTALDSATMGPSYRAGVLRSAAIDQMEALEADSGVRAVAYEMLGPPRLTKLLFEAELLERMFGTLEAACALDAEDASHRAAQLVTDDDDLRRRMLTVGIPVLLPDGETLLRGPTVRVTPDPHEGLAANDPRLVERGWVDLRVENWARWRRRCADLSAEIRSRPSIEQGSGGDHEYGDGVGRIRPGRMGAWIFRREDRGERIKR